MAKTKKPEAAATETAQDVREQSEVSQDTQEGETVSEAAESGQETPVGRGETTGPGSASDLLGCQEEETAELEEAEFIEYAVAAKGGLRLREEPSLKAPVVAELPCGIGVLGNARPAENGWRQVFTGRLFGWVMDKFLEPLELPELGNGAE